MKKELASKDKVLSRLFKKYGQLDWPKTDSDAFSCLVHAIIAQQISAKSADSVWAKLNNFVPSIDAQSILNIDEAGWKKIGVPNFRVSYIRNLCNFTKNNDLAEINHDNYEEQRKKLLAIKGIGPWTIEMLAIFHLNHLDIFPLGDIGVIRAINELYNDSNKLSGEELREISANWKPYRTIATLYLWRSSEAYWVEY